jgi:cell division septum initiation protein DivIVA
MLRETHNAAYEEIAAMLDQLSVEMDHYAQDLERLEQRLTVLEEKMLAIAHAAETSEQLLHARQELEIELRPYRSKMSAPQLAMLEKQYLDRRLLERQKLPRLSLFYLR